MNCTETGTNQLLLSCMAYVDLSPVRAGMADTPESSDYTSIKERIAPTDDDVWQQTANDIISLPIKPLAAFVEQTNDSTENTATIPFRFEQYLELVDWTGRIVRGDKRGSISAHLPSILERMKIDADSWARNSSQFERVANREFPWKRRRRASG